MGGAQEALLGKAAVAIRRNNREADLPAERVALARPG
jgi:hypothetical protein